MKKIISIFLFLIGLFACDNNPKNDSSEENAANKKVTATDSVTTVVQTISVAADTYCKNDSLDEMAHFIAGMNYGDSAKVLSSEFKNKKFISFSESFSKKWANFDSSRISTLVKFRDNELNKLTEVTGTLFYPFSGPDILYGNIFFPKAKRYIMMGLEPVGTRAVFDFTDGEKDSLNTYFNKINTSLNAILRYSFFRTASMKEDLRNEELDGTLHVLMLFLARNGNTICNAVPISIDSLGTIQQQKSFASLKVLNAKNKGVKIDFYSPDGIRKELFYFSLNLADGALKFNKGMQKFIEAQGNFTTYLKGASYLMHETYFSIIRNFILNQSTVVVQDDSGIAFRYFLKHTSKWQYYFYGEYTKPIKLFSYTYQPDLDSLYKLQGSKKLGFGIGYNFKDKNSNLMIAIKR